MNLGIGSNAKGLVYRRPHIKGRERIRGGESADPVGAADHPTATNAAGKQSRVDGRAVIAAWLR